MRRLLLYLFLAFPFFSSAQIQVADTSTLAQAVESLVSDGVQISNITSNCHSSAWGTFLDTSGYLGINEGLVLASGSIFDVPGPNNAPGAGQDLMTPGDADLNGIVGGNTQDACYIQFDVRPSADTLVFNYVFGSEEYDEFVCSNFNDVFAFLISGPGITGKKKQLLEVMSAREEQIKEYLKEKKVAYGTREGLIMVVNYFNSLLDSSNGNG